MNHDPHVSADCLDLSGQLTIWARCGVRQMRPSAKLERHPPLPQATALPGSPPPIPEDQARERGGEVPNPFGNETLLTEMKTVSNASNCLPHISNQFSHPSKLIVAPRGLTPLARDLYTVTRRPNPGHPTGIPPSVSPVSLVPHPFQGSRFHEFAFSRIRVFMNSRFHEFRGVREFTFSQTNSSP